MRRATVLCGLMLCAMPASAERLVREFLWSKVMANGAPEGTEVLSPGKGKVYERLRVRNARGKSATVTVLTVESPPITRATYAITGLMNHEGVEGKGYLEMWSFFPDGGMYSSRGLAEWGPMKHLEGTSGWRELTLPFVNKEGAPKPVKLVVNVVLPGPGTVTLGPLRLLEYAPGENVLASGSPGTRSPQPSDLEGAPGQGRLGQPAAWWGDREAGILGGVLGMLLGGMGALIGFLAGRGKARGFVLSALVGTAALGVVALAIGAVAAVRSQPYVVCYPLFLFGVLSTVIPAGLFFRLRRRYEELELRKMQAQDARAS